MDTQHVQVAVDDDRKLTYRSHNMVVRCVGRDVEGVRWLKRVALFRGIRL